MRSGPSTKAYAPTRGGNWSLSLETATRPLEEVPTKRRAMYRRRYAMLEALRQAVRALVDMRGASLPTPVAMPVSAVTNASTLEPLMEDDRL